MSIQELKEKRGKAAKEIFYILKQFEEETKIPVDSISLTKVETIERSSLVGVNLHLDL